MLESYRIRTDLAVEAREHFKEENVEVRGVEVKGYYKRQNYENQVTHVATRLDRDTSGLVVFPKHRFAHAVLDEQLKKHLVKKNYLALIKGKVPTEHGYIDAPIQRDPNSFVKRMVGKEGKASVTEYWRQECNIQASLIKIRLHTGRTHLRSNRY